jgi:hypothetical protein
MININLIKSYISKNKFKEAFDTALIYAINDLRQYIYNTYSIYARYDLDTPFYIDTDDIDRFYEALYSELRNFTRAFEIYCIDKVYNTNANNIKYKLNDKLFESNEISVISFNYTNTFEQFYASDQNMRRKLFKYNYIYPHGRFSHINNESQLVLGTKSFNFDLNNDSNSKKLFKFQKYTQRHTYDTIVDFQKLLRNLKNFAGSINIYVIGHSLDEIDLPMLKYIFSINKNAIITVFYHNELLFEKYQINMTKFLGEEDATIRVRFKYQHDKNDGLLMPINS